MLYNELDKIDFKHNSFGDTLAFFSRNVLSILYNRFCCMALNLLVGQTVNNTTKVLNHLGYVLHLD
jgi:hypothetical protein